MQLTVLGNNGPYPGAARACSGYLLSLGDTRILLDCGSGVLARLQVHQELNQLTAIVLSHLHYDHISDLYVLRYAIDASRRMGLRRGPLPIYGPPEPEGLFSSLAYKDNFILNPVRGGDSIVIGPCHLSYLPTIHALPCLAIRVTGAGRQFVYSGDTEYFPDLVPFVAGTNLFLCEANYRQQDIAAGKSNHLSALQAATLAGEAGVENLLLTHLAPGSDEEELLAEARRVFPRAEVARENGIYEV